MAKRNNPPDRQKPSGRQDRFGKGVFRTTTAAFHALGHRFRRIIPRAKTVVREHRARNFPESNRAALQFLLFLGGMITMWRSLLGEKLHNFRMKHLGSEAGAPRWRARRMHPLLFICGGAVLAVIAIFFSLYTFATNVSYNGTTLGIAESTPAAKRVAAQVETITSETLDQAFRFPDDALQYSTRLVRRSEVDSSAELEQDLTREVGLVAYGYSLYVDGELIGSTEYEGALEDLLEQVKQMYVSEDTLSVDFEESVRVSAGYVPAETLTNLGHIAQTLNSTKSGEVIYTVAAGDTWGQIAMDNGMSSDELSQLNPGYDINKLQIGDELIISNAVSYLTVVVTERQNYVDVIPYDIVYVDDPSLYKGDYRTLSPGEYGTCDVVADVEYVNGVETKRDILSSVTLTDPVSEQRARGTKERPSWVATGRFRWPASGHITSYFGYRNTGIRGASRNHMGIDIACAYGSPIYAADGGTVRSAGWWGAGGYTVVIDHGNGFTTYYEHCSSMLVSAGQHVYKGQQIARVGRSGVASGAHCHFGVQRNGVYVNPLNYL